MMLQHIKPCLMAGLDVFSKASWASLKYIYRLLMTISQQNQLNW